MCQNEIFTSDDVNRLERGVFVQAQRKWSQRYMTLFVVDGGHLQAFKPKVPDSTSGLYGMEVYTLAY